MPINDNDTRKEYFHTKNVSKINIRVNSKEKAVLEARMKKEGWENLSGFVKYCLFGDNPEYKYKKLLKEDNQEQMAIVLNAMVHDLIVNLNYYRFRYERDMRQLYREEGVDLRAWVKATYEPHIKAIQLLTDTYASLRQIADHFNIEISSTHLTIAPENSEHPTKEEQDRIAQELYEKGLLEIGKWDFTQH